MDETPIEQRYDLTELSEESDSGIAGGQPESAQPKKHEGRLKAAIFDLDGLLADTEPLHFEAWRIIFGKHGKALSKRRYMHDFVGAGDHIVADDLVSKRMKESGRKKQIEEIVKEKREIFAGLAGKSRPFKEAVDFAASLKGILLLAVATSTEKESTNLILDAIKSRDLFDVIATGSEVDEPKPAPDVYSLAAKKLGISPDECIAFEDTPAGIEAAKAAGVHCVAVPNIYTKHLDFSKADYTTHTFTKLSLIALERIAAGKYASANEEEIVDTIIRGFDWEEALSTIVMEHGLDPENIDINRLANAFIVYLHRMKSIDFRVPARFVLVAAILLSMKVESFLESEEEKLSTLNTSALDVPLEAPLLAPPADRKATRPVSLTELISALNKAFEIKSKKESIMHRKAAPLILAPQQKPVDIEIRVKEIYDRIHRKGIMTFSDLVPVWKRADIINVFLPLLYLTHRGKVECRQEKMFGEIRIKLVS